MQIKCVRAFGNFRPGDVVDVPDEALFDVVHFERLAEVKPKTATVEGDK